MKALAFGDSDYDPISFPNPALQRHYRVLEAVALDEDVEESLNTQLDRIQPDVDGFAQASGIIDTLSKAVLEAAASLPPPVAAAAAAPKAKAKAAPKKRKASGDESDDSEAAAAAPKAKKPSVKAEIKAEGEGGVVDWKALWLSGSLQTETIPVLKDALRALGQPVSGSKPVLLDRLRELFK